MAAILFLTGNGFALAHGLKAGYGDFLNVYVHEETSDLILEKFRTEIGTAQKETWADAEMDFGEFLFSKVFSYNPTAAFKRCLDDFQERFYHTRPAVFGRN